MAPAASRRRCIRLRRRRGSRCRGRARRGRTSPRSSSVCSPGAPWGRGGWWKI